MIVREFPSTPSLRQCLIDDVHVMYFRGPIDVSTLDATMRANAEIKKLLPDGIWAFNLAIPSLSLPDRAIQKKASEAAKAVEGYLRGAVVVLPGEGFWVSAARAFVAGLMLLSPLRQQREFASDIADGAKNLARRSNRDEAWARELAAQIDAFIASPDR